MSYCSFSNSLNQGEQEVHKVYHDHHYGFPIASDDELFCRLVLEINQAGLSWTTILNKQENFRKAYHNFSIKKVAGYKQKDIDRLLNDAGIIRNRLKVNANTKTEWTLLFKKTFSFTGGEIVNEFLMSTGYLPGAHDENCPVHKKVLKTKPAWAATKK